MATGRGNWIPVLGFLLWLVSSQLVLAAEGGPTAVVQASLGLSDPPETGHYHLWRQGNQVTASLVGQRIEATDRKLLFVVPEGFRPPSPVQWSVTGHQLSQGDGQNPDPKVNLTLRVLPNGIMYQTLAIPPESGGLLRYASHITWLTEEPLFSVAGPYRDPHIPMHRAFTKGMYHLERRGSQVWATLMTRHPPLAERAQDREPLFTVPQGLRPNHSVVWSLQDYRGNQFKVRVMPDGKVTYGQHPLNADGSALSLPVFGYRARLNWTTAEPARLVAAGPFLAQPVSGAGQYRLERRANTVLAHLEADAAPVPPWVRPSSSRPQISVRPPGEIYGADLEVKSRPYRQGTTLGELESGSATRYDLLGQSTGYRQRPPYEWQIRFADDTVGWVKSFPVQTHGDISGIPLTSRLFQVPEGFRPEQTQAWTVKTRSVDDQGQDVPTSEPAELAIQVSPEGFVTYASEGSGLEAGYRRYRTAIAWSAGTDLCYRSEAIQKAILRALHQRGHFSVACSRVTWADLANIHTLEVTTFDLQWEFSPGYVEAPFQRFLPHDLSGLSGLRSLKVVSDYQVYTGRVVLDLVPPLLLAHVPQLRELSLEGVWLTQVPADFLVHTPQLQRLVLNLDAGIELPPGMLGFTPHLQSLELHLDPSLTRLPADFLAYTPPLRHLRLKVSREILFPLLPRLLTATPHLEALHLQVTGEDPSPLPAGFLQHTPQLKEAILWQDSAPSGAPSGQLVLADPAYFLAHAPQLQRLWLHRVEVGHDFVAGLPATTEIHWVPRDSATFPSPSRLAAPQPQSWLHIHAEEALPPSFLPAGSPLNLALTISSSSPVPDAMVAWLSQLSLRGFVLDAVSQEADIMEQVLEVAGAALRFRDLTRVSLQLGWAPAFSMLTDLLFQHTYDWLFLKPLPLNALPPDFFADFTATALLLEHGASTPWSLRPFHAEQRTAWHQLLQAPNVRHLGLVLDTAESRLDLPPGLLGDLDFACLELELSPYRPALMHEMLQPFLAAEDLQLEWQPREDSRGPYSLWPPWTEPRMRLTQPTWFEASHVPWARERGCPRSLYLHLRSANQATLSPAALEPVGQLRYVRLTYVPALCPDCPSTLAAHP